jgi:hypothetical protein
VEVVKIMAQDTLEQQLYEARLKAWRDEDSLRVGSFQEGELKGTIKTLLASIQLYLNLRFGPSSQILLDRIGEIQDSTQLEEIQRTIFQANSLEEIEELLSKRFPE